jgi:damage-control phosphatase, subfamily I
MKTYLDCIPCFMLQALRAGKFATKDESKIKEILDRVGCAIQGFSLDQIPPEMADVIYREIKNITGVEDPYKEIKRANIDEANSLYPELKNWVKDSEDPLLTAIRIAIAGNVIDLGVNKDFNIVEDLKKIIKQDFAIFDYQKFIERLEKTESILYLGDNAGESVFDKILIEELKKPVTYAVREIPIINDVTLKDAYSSGLHEVAEIISSGSTAPATILKLCNEDFMKRFNQSEFIISKGQGNFEGLSGSDRPIFFLLKAKCKVIAKELNVTENDIILKSIN